MDAHQAQNARAYGSIFDCLTGCSRFRIMESAHQVRLCGLDVTHGKSLLWLEVCRLSGVEDDNNGDSDNMGRVRRSRIRDER
jgi:hypothetical protein